VLGTKQSGLPGFRLADLSAHGPLLDLARDEARKIVEENPRPEGAHGEALRLLLNIFERGEAIRLLRGG
jgi:ATP-dependent DNA helicase RecG